LHQQKQITMLNNDTVNQFIINVQLINPVQKIVDNLTIKNYRDCDIKWLNEKLETYTKLAVKIQGLEITIISQPETSQNDVKLNDYVYGKFLYYFTTLLNCFKSIN